MSTNSANNRLQPLGFQGGPRDPPRQIVQLLSASLLDKRPTFIPTPKRHKGAAAKGVAYEKKALRELRLMSLGRIHYHQWIEFWADGKKGYAEPEAYVVFRNFILLFEMKLTGRTEGRMQMEGLYKPLLEKIYSRPVKCLMVCKWVTEETPRPLFNSPEDFLSSGKDYGTYQLML